MTMLMKQTTMQTDLYDFKNYPYAFVDFFAGGGGASEGIKSVIGRDPDIAINHDAVALSMHAANHLTTVHLDVDVFEHHPKKVVKNKKIIAWFSPDCTFHANAKGKVLDRHTAHEDILKQCKKGTKCVAQNNNKATRVRGLAWVALGYAMCVDMPLFFLENVKEFQKWGPVILNKKDEYVADKTRKGETYKAFIQCLTTGIPHDSPVLPEIRDFLEVFLGEDYDENKLFKGLGYRVETNLLKACDFGAPTIRERFFMVARNDNKPIVWPKRTHQNPEQKTVDKNLKVWRGAYEVMDFSVPGYSIFMSEAEAKQRKLKIKRPLKEPTLRRLGRGLEKFVICDENPFVIASSGNLRAPWIVKNYGGEKGGFASSIKAPLGTVTTVDHNSFATAILTPFISTYFGEREVDGKKVCDGRGSKLTSPLSVITSGGRRHSLVLPELLPFNQIEKGSESTKTIYDPITGAYWDPIIMEGILNVRAFLKKYTNLNDPELLCGILTINGQKYQMIDIKLRMLIPRELFSAQGFPETYIIDRTHTGKKLSKKEQIKMVGNSVSPKVAEALVAVNLPTIKVA